jgi:hypothetical protein
MMLIKIRGDRGSKLAQFLCEEAPPDRPFVRREHKDKDQQESKDPNAPDSPTAAADGAATEEKSAEILGIPDKVVDEKLAEAETTVQIGEPGTPNRGEVQG